MVEIMNNKFINVNEFKGNLYIHIRSYYDKDGELKPGKGISLKPEEWDQFVENFEEIKKYVNENVEEFYANKQDEV